MLTSLALIVHRIAARMNFSSAKLLAIIAPAATSGGHHRRKRPALFVMAGILLALGVASFYASLDAVTTLGVSADYRHCTDEKSVGDTPQIIRAEKLALWAAAERTYSDAQHDPLEQQFVPARPVAVLGIAVRTAHIRVTSDNPENPSYARVWLPIFQSYHPQLHEWCTAVLITTPTSSDMQTFGNGPYL
jgi:hypothetical protein